MAETFADGAKNIWITRDDWRDIVTSAFRAGFEAGVEYRSWYREDEYVKRTLTQKTFEKSCDEYIQECLDAEII